MTQEVAARDRADDLAPGIGDAQVPEAQALDAPDGAVQEVVLAHGLQWRTGNGSDGRREARLAARVDGAQHVALGDDADLTRGGAHEHAAAGARRRATWCPARRTPVARS